VNSELIAQKKSGSNYSVFGLNLHSNLPLPGVTPSYSSAIACEVEVHLGLRPYSGEEGSQCFEQLTYTSPYTNKAGEPMLRIFRVEQGDFVRLAYEDGTQFWLDREPKNIWAIWPPALSL
jgi:hypothetical protein